MAKRGRKIKKIKAHKLDRKDLERLNIDDSPGWYLDDPNNSDVRWSGPFDTKDEAMDIRRGLEYFWRHEYEPQAS